MVEFTRVLSADSPLRRAYRASALVVPDLWAPVGGHPCEFEFYKYFVSAAMHFSVAPSCDST